MQSVSEIWYEGEKNQNHKQNQTPNPQKPMWARQQSAAAWTPYRNKHIALSLALKCRIYGRQTVKGEKWQVLTWQWNTVIALMQSERKRTAIEAD